MVESYFISCESESHQFTNNLDVVLINTGAVMIKTNAGNFLSNVCRLNKSTFNLVKKSGKSVFFSSRILGGLFVLFIFSLTTAYSQTGYSPNSFTSNQPGNNYMANSTAFKQEIAKMEINVVRQGKDPLPLTQVPRLEKNDILKVRMLEDQVNGMKPDQSNWNWTFLVAFINPGRNNEKDEIVSDEIQFRKSGWYNEYSFTVPYDCQPMFFLYSKPNYKGKILNLVSKNQDEIRKIGEKTIELSGAYAKISSFLNELQYVVNSSTYGFNNYAGNYAGSYSAYGNSPYGTTYGGYSGYGSYGAYGTTPGFNANLFMNQTVERLARSFNIQLPNTCGQFSGYNSYGSTYGNQNNFYGVSPDFIGRTQCVAKSVRLEDFDFSVSRLLQQGGILATAQLTQKYPQLAFWINIAAAALDFINRINKKAPLRIVPTVIASSDSQGQTSGYQANFTNNFSSNQVNPGAAQKNDVKITLYAESAPNDTGFVTAYPLVVQKWQASPDPEVISLPKPVLSEPCLHAGMNILKSTDLITDWMSDKFTTDFKLVISSHNGFHKEFPLKKNIGFNGWELNLTKEELEGFPKINIELESVITGRRGFNDIESPKFRLPIPMTSKWEVTDESQKAFAVGEKRTVTLSNPFGNCRCMQAVIYKPSFGGQFIFDTINPENSLIYSEDGKEVSFVIDATNFQPGVGQLELRQFGGEVFNLAINLYPAPPEITDFKISRGDNKAVIYGVRLDQLQAVKINGKRAIVEGRAADANKPTNQNATGIPTGLSAYQTGVPVVSYSVDSSPSEKTVVFEDPNAKQDSNSISLELELTEGRQYKYPKTFSVTASRPLIASNNVKEVEGVAIINPLIDSDAAEKTTGSKLKFPFILSDLTVFPVSASKISVDVQNALTDYDFKIENIQIETKIENAELSKEELPKVSFEVLDWKTMKIIFQLNEASQKVLGGRRLQFRIRDKIRGISDWYTVSKTFARMPEEITVNCAGNIKGNCQLVGEGIQYINQVSVDGGKTWYPQDASSLNVQTKPNGQKAASIPYFTNKALLKIKLRDFSSGEGMSVTNYIFSRVGKVSNK